MGTNVRRMVSRSFIPPPSLFSQNDKEYNMQYLFELFKPLYSLVPQCDFIMFTQSMQDLLIQVHVGRNPYLAPSPTPSLSSPFGLYDFFLFKTICDMCMVLSTSIMDEITKIFVLREENYHQELKGGGLCTSLCTYWPDLGNSSREIPVFNFQRTVCWFKLTLECNNNCKLLNFNHSK